MVELVTVVCLCRGNGANSGSILNPLKSCNLLRLLSDSPKLTGVSAHDLSLSAITFIFYCSSVNIFAFFTLLILSQYHQ